MENKFQTEPMLWTIAKSITGELKFKLGQLPWARVGLSRHADPTHVLSAHQGLLVLKGDTFDLSSGLYSGKEHL